MAFGARAAEILLGGSDGRWHIGGRPLARRVSLLRIWLMPPALGSPTGGSTERLILRGTPAPAARGSSAALAETPRAANDLDLDRSIQRYSQQRCWFGAALIAPERFASERRR